MQIAKILGKMGSVDRAMKSAYEHRPQQLEMAEAVETALRAKTHLVVEAGTGVGKSLAYLVPVILRAREENCRVVVSTYTKALPQEGPGRFPLRAVRWWRKLPVSPAVRPVADA